MGIVEMYLQQCFQWNIKNQGGEVPQTHQSGKGSMLVFGVLTILIQILDLIGRVTGTLRLM